MKNLTYSKNRLPVSMTSWVSGSTFWAMVISHCISRHPFSNSSIIDWDTVWVVNRFCLSLRIQSNFSWRKTPSSLISSNSLRPPVLCSSFALRSANVCRRRTALRSLICSKIGARTPKAEVCVRRKRLTNEPRFNMGFQRPRISTLSRLTPVFSSTKSHIVVVKTTLWSSSPQRLLKRDRFGSFDPLLRMSNIGWK